MLARTRLLVLLGAAVATGAGVSCVARDRMCVSASECASPAMCVAGRCQAKGTPIIAHPAIRRVVLRPVEMAYVSRADTSGRVPREFVLGREADTVLLMRFDAQAVTPADRVVEAYVLLDRAPRVDADPTPFSLHAERVVQAWDARSITWPRQPALQEERSPATVVTGSGRPTIRIDVRSIVDHWKNHDPRDQGIGIVAATTSATGMAFASVATGMEPFDAPQSYVPGDTSRLEWMPSGPRLELYLLPATVNLSAAASSNGAAALSSASASASTSKPPKPPASGASPNVKPQPR